MSGREHADLLGLLNGELPPGQRRQAAAHLSRCPQCRAELADDVRMIGELRDAARHAPAEPAAVPAPPDVWAARTEQTILGRRPSTDRRRRLPAGVTAAAAVAGVALVVGIAVGRSSRPAAPVAAAVVQLAAQGAAPTAATGTARMVGSGSGQTMQLTLRGLAAPPPGDRYAIWLLDTRTGRALRVGIVPPTGSAAVTARYPAPAKEVVGFNAVDVTLQTPADRGDHSRDSVLRGQL